MPTSARQPNRYSQPPSSRQGNNQPANAARAPQPDEIDPELHAALVTDDIADAARTKAAEPTARASPDTAHARSAPAQRTPPEQQPAPALRIPPAQPSVPAQRAEPARTSSQPAARKRWLTPAAIFAIVVTALLYFGWHVPTERYITPKRGFGYALGIIGGSLMLLLFLYSARKRIPWLKFLGPTAGWFRFHMVLGVLGPLCILYHANFSLGATNSNVALFCMLTVAGSGLIGRYIYSRIHHGLYGSKLSLGELRKGAENLRSSSGVFAFLPGLMEGLDTSERKLLTSTGKVPVLGIARLIASWAISWRERLRLHGYVRKSLRDAARNSKTIAAQRKRLRRTAFAYIDRRLAATRRVAGFEAYERLFSLWHALHLPLIFIMLIAGIVHVIAVHVY